MGIATSVKSKSSLYESVYLNTINNGKTALNGISFGTSLKRDIALTDVSVRRRLIRNGYCPLINSKEVSKYARDFTTQINHIQNSIFYRLSHYLHSRLEKEKIDSKLIIEAEVLFGDVVDGEKIQVNLKPSNQVKLTLKFNPASNSDVSDNKLNRTFIRNFIKIALPMATLHNCIDSMPMLSVLSNGEGIYNLEVEVKITVFTLTRILEQPEKEILSELDEHEPVRYSESERQWLREIERQKKLPTPYLAKNHKFVQEWYEIDHLNYCKLDNSQRLNEQNLSLGSFDTTEAANHSFDWIND